MSDDAARTAPAVARNRTPIAEMLRQWLPHAARVLEIASGTGEHAVWFSRALPDMTWQPTDQDPQALASIAAWREASGLSNLLQPLHLDATAPQGWPVSHADAVVAINMIHIAPWRATEGLMSGAAHLLAPGGLLILYGPFREDGVPFAPSNAAFDLDLQARNLTWGVRDLGDVTDLATRHGFELAGRTLMPANNLGVLFRRR